MRGSGGKVVKIGVKAVSGRQWKRATVDGCSVGISKDSSTRSLDKTQVFPMCLQEGSLKLLPRFFVCCQPLPVLRSTNKVLGAVRAGRCNDEELLDQHWEIRTCELETGFLEHDNVLGDAIAVYVVGGHRGVEGHKVLWLHTSTVEAEVLDKFRGRYFVVEQDRVLEILVIFGKQYESSCLLVLACPNLYYRNLTIANPCLIKRLY